MKNTLYILLLIALSFLNQTFAENTAPDALNKCLKIETEGSENFVFSPDGKNFAYTIGGNLYKNGEQIISSQKEIVGIGFLNDNENIIQFSNFTFNSPKLEKFGINYNKIGYTNTYPKDSINKEYGSLTFGCFIGFKYCNI